MNKTQHNALWYGGGWLLLTLWLRLCLPESLMGWERHQLFRFSADYFTTFAPTPYPVLFYLQAFFTQFYLYPLLGAAVMGGLLVAGMGAWRRLTGRWWTGWVWVAAMLPLLAYFNLLWLLFWLAVLGGGLLARALARSSKGLWLPCSGLAGLGFIALLLLQEQAVWAVLFWSLVYCLEKRPAKHTLCALAALLSGVGLGLTLLLAAYPLYYAQHLGAWTMFLQTITAWLGFPSAYFTPPTVVKLWVYIGGGLCLALPLVSLMPPKWLARRWARISGQVLVAILGLCTAYLPLRYQMEDLYKTDRLGGEGRWHEAAIVAERAFWQRAKPESLPRPKRPVFEENQRQNARWWQRIAPRPVQAQHPVEESFLADMLKISLLANREATSYLFAYNGSLHFPILFSEVILNYPSTYLIACYYASQGFYAEALHLFYDFVTSGRTGTTVLAPILWNSVVTGDYEPCRKFIRLFEQSLFHKDIARRYTAYLADTAGLTRQPDIAAARQRLSNYDYTVVGYQPDDAMYSRLKYDGENAAVYEYALCLWMVYKNHPRILAEWPKIRRFYLKQVPVHLQEAVLANYEPAQLEDIPEGIDPAVAARYADFGKAYDLHQKGYLTFESLSKDFKNTYWYYFAFGEFKTWDAVAAAREAEAKGRVSQNI